MGLEYIRTGEPLYTRHVDGFRLDAVVDDYPGADTADLGSYQGSEVMAGGDLLSVEEIEGLAHYEATGGAEASL